MKPSARVYPESNSWYCFACNATRDAIETVKAKEGLDFWPAVKKLEAAFGLEPLPYEEDDRTDAISVVASNLDPQRSFEQDEQRVRTLLDGLTRDRLLLREKLLAFWEAFDKVVFHVRGPRGGGGDWSEKKGRVMLEGLRGRAIEAVKEHQKGT